MGYFRNASEDGLVITLRHFCVLVDATSEYLHPSVSWIGFDGLVAKMRPSSVEDTEERVATFHKNLISAKTDCWVYTSNTELSRVARWVSSTCTWVYRDMAEGELFYRWRGRFFVVSDPYFEKIISTFLSCTLIYILGTADRFIPTVSVKGAVVLNLTAPDTASNVSDFSLYASFRRSPLLFMYYSRILSYLLTTTRHVLSLY